MFGIKTNIKLYIQNKKIKKRYPLSFVRLVEPTKIDNIFVGKGTYGDLKVISYSKYDGKLHIGNYCSIARNTTFLIGGEHNYNRISTYPFKKMYLNEDEATCKGNIYVEDDVWIGYGSTILSGVRIGRGSIIGAESIVTKDVPPYAVYVGNRIIKYRFENEIIQKLLKLNYEKLNKENIKNSIDTLYKDINKENIDQIIELINNS